VLELHFLDTHDLAQARTRRGPPLECAGAPAKCKCLPHAPNHEGFAFSRHGSAAWCKQGPRVAFLRHAWSSVGTLGFHQIPPGWEVRFCSVAYSAIPIPDVCALLWQQQLGS